MYNDSITIMIISTIPDMFAEHYYFIKHVFPHLKEICRNHEINLDYVDLVFSISDVELSQGRSVRKYFQSIDLDRAFFLCFRGQKLGRSPTYKTIDKTTLDEYPELVDYIGDISFTELITMHALCPFEKQKAGENDFVSPVKHALFYFRDDKFLDGLDSSQKKLYTDNGVNEDDFVRDLKLAMAKDLIVANKREFDEEKGMGPHINIRKYEGIWDNDLPLIEVLSKYAKEYADLNNLSYDYLIKIINKMGIGDFKGSFRDFKCEDRELKEIIAEDFFNEMRLEFPDLF